MPHVKVPLNTGIDIYADPEEVGAKGNVELENCWINFPGKLISRPYTKELTLKENFLVKSMTRWSSETVNGGFVWIVAGYKEENDYPTLWMVSRDFSSWDEIIEGENVKVSWSRLSKIPNKVEVLGDVVLFTNGLSNTPTRFKYYNGNWWQNSVQFNGFFYDIAHPRNDFLSFDSSINISETTGGTLKNGTYYFYKAVPVFDGIQEASLENHYIYAQSQSDTQKFLITLYVNKEFFNPRCTSVNIYRAENPVSELEENLTYHKIKSVSSYNPVSQDGGIFDTCSPLRRIASNGAYNFGAGNGKWTANLTMVILDPQEGSIGANQYSPVCSRIRNRDTPSTAFPWSGYAMQNGTPVEGYCTSMMHLPDYDGTWNSTHNWDIWNIAGSFEGDDRGRGKDCYSINGYSHNDPDDATDNATDTMYLKQSLRETQQGTYNSSGEKPYLILSRYNRIRNSGDNNGYTYSGRQTPDPGDEHNDAYDWTTGDWGSNPSWQKVDGSGDGSFGSSYNQIISFNESPYGVARPSIHMRAYSPGGSTLDPASGNNGIAQPFYMKTGESYWITWSANWTMYGYQGSSMNTRHIVMSISSPTEVATGGGATGTGWKSWYSGDVHRDGLNAGWFEQQVNPYGGNSMSDTYWGTTGFRYDCTDTGEYWFHMRLHNENSLYGMYADIVNWRLKDLGCYKILNPTASTTYYGGEKVIIPINEQNYDGSGTTFADFEYAGGNAFIGTTKLPIETNLNTLFTLTSPMPSNLLSGNRQVTITKTVNITPNHTHENDEVVKIEFQDIGYTSVEEHPTQEIPINPTYQYSQYIEGRLFVAWCRYTSQLGDQIEEDPNMVMFSELEAPNQIPITNFIKVQDNQGGRITGLSEIMGNLIVFMENSIWRLLVPSSTPNAWSLLESSKELGCTSPESIFPYEGGIFFANKEGIFMMSQNFMPTEMSRPWRDHYQDNYDDYTLIHFCPKSKMLYVNQNNEYETWCLDLNIKDNLSWVKLIDRGETSDKVGWSGFAYDDTSRSFFWRNKKDIDSDQYDVEFGELEARTGNNKLRMKKKTGWIRLGDLKENKTIRRINMRYKNKYEGDNFAPNLNIYTDGSDDVVYTVDGDKLFSDKTGNEANFSLRVGIRCKYFAIEFHNDDMTEVLNDTRDLFELLTVEVEWEQ
tara:strand:- start:5057 stop:8524 length:3468 start_codon:yes stop_codon:yes gene_type:complete